MRYIEISGRRIGEEYAPFIMAEAGINHEGDLGKALQLVDAAAVAQADCIKFQCHITEAEMVPTDMTPGDISSDRLWDIIKRCELTEDEERLVQARCAEKGILYLSTPFSREAADRLESFGVPAFKIGSGECNNLPLLRHVARKGKPVILSTGMNDLESVARSVALLREEGAPFMLMHCTSAYPAAYEHVRLGAVRQLADTFSVPVGLSDHSMGIYTCLGAVALGACALEKHFTLSRQWPGPDTPMSIEPKELKELVVGSKAVFLARGGVKDILPVEEPVIRFAYASVVTIRDVEAGEVFSMENIWVKRPGDGPLHAREFDKVLGRKASRNLASGVPLSPEDIVLP